MKRILLNPGDNSVAAVIAVENNSDGLLVPDDHPVRAGDRVDVLPGGQVEVLPPVVQLEQRQATMLAELATHRWQATQRFDYDGVETWAEPAIVNLTAKVVAMQAIGDPALTCAWKLAPGEFRTWNMQALVAFGLAVNDYVQRCFAREADFTETICSATTHAQLDAVDISAGWTAV